MAGKDDPSAGRARLPSPPAVIAALVALAALLSLPALRGADRAVDPFGNFLRFAGRMLPPDFSVLPAALAALGETFQIAFLATLFAFALSVPVAAAASRNLAPRWLAALTRAALNAVRTIPGLIWAVLAVAVVGANPQAGAGALTFYSLGYLGKFFSDAFESVNMEVAEGLRAAGASRIQAFQHGVWPFARPLIWSHALWMLEYNIRSAAIVGYVGAGGIGLLLQSYVEYARWDRFCAVLCVLFAAVWALDAAGTRLRAALAR